MKVLARDVAEWKLVLDLFRICDKFRLMNVANYIGIWGYIQRRRNENENERYP